MTIILNGERKEIAANLTVRELIESLGLGKAACAAEVNKELVPKRDHAERVLRENDRVELVTLVGGG
ncbi:MAG: sulfur carrier protein ThiS [Planctomycetota bacterium]|nr:sulfur carrier protein ThiS [Planctomycetota bacterium]